MTDSNFQISDTPHSRKRVGHNASLGIWLVCRGCSKAFLVPYNLRHRIYCSCHCMMVVRHTDPIYAKRHAARQSDKLKRFHQDPEFEAKLYEAAIASHKTPEYRSNKVHEMRNSIRLGRFERCQKILFNKLESINPGKFRYNYVIMLDKSIREKYPECKNKWYKADVVYVINEVAILIIEVDDGYGWHSSDAARTRDCLRDKINLVENKLPTLRVTNEDVDDDVDDVVLQIFEVINCLLETK